MIFRSATLGSLSAADSATLVDLGIRRVADFRTAGERESAPDVLPDDVEGVVFDVLGDQPSSMAASLAHIGMPGDDSEMTPEAAAAAARGIADALGEGRGIALLQDSYRQFVETDSARTAYHGFFAALTEEGEYRPTLFHCSAGKDRTGWAAAVFLLLLGADEATVLEDYLLTNVDIMPMVEPMLAKAEANGLDPEMLLPVLTVQPEMLGAALAAMRAEYGTVEEYFVRGLGLEEDRLRVLRDRFIAA
ncbi:tyrosine-protein phosphatase [Leucobacter sp. BZR 635]